MSEIQVQEKRAIEQKQEDTIPARSFAPSADIYETEQALTVVLEMPGLKKDSVEINVEDNVLAIHGTIEFERYQDLRPIYTEYPIGHYRRSFSLSNRIDQHKIVAEMNDGVLTITLPKAEVAKPRKIGIG